MDPIEYIICQWLTSLKNKKASSISLADVRRLAAALKEVENGIR